MYAQYIKEHLEPVFNYYKEVTEISQKSTGVAELIESLSKLALPEEPEGENRHGINSTVCLGVSYLLTKGYIDVLFQKRQISQEEKSFLYETARYMLRNRIFNSCLQVEIATAAVIKAREGGGTSKSDDNRRELYNRLEEELGPQISISFSEMRDLRVDSARMQELVSHMLSAAKVYGPPEECLMATEIKFNFEREALMEAGVEKEIFDYNVIDNIRKAYWYLLQLAPMV